MRSLRPSVRSLRSLRLLALAAPFVATPLLAQGTRVTKASTATTSAAPNVQVVPHEADHRVDVLVDGKPFTSFLYPTNLPKQVLYPIVAANGTPITRGWPLEPRPGERVDHPHHIGLWFNHSDVNGLDFWNNSDAIPAARKDKYGSIVHKAIRSTKSGAGEGVLEVENEWVKPDGKPIMRETVRYVFHAGADMRGIDRTSTLTALDVPVVFRDNKDGTLGLRVRRELEQPADKPEIFTDGSGIATPVPVLNNTGVTGKFWSADGITGDSVWSTRSRWTALSGVVNGAPITVAIIDNPKNYNFPTYWHARGYGLFAANEFGAKDFTAGKTVDNYTLQPGKSMTLKHRVVILNGATNADRVEQQFKDFSR